MLELESVHAYYGDSHVLHGISMRVDKGEVACLLGRNGAGKTTTLLSIMGYLTPRPGRIDYGGRSLVGVPTHRMARAGLGFVPQERGIFPSLTVEENLTVAALRRGDGRWDLEGAYKLFPRLHERRANLGFQLSGGEQQMLAIARALMLNPDLILLDEPSEGLAPLIVREIGRILLALKAERLSLLLVEQNYHLALRVADRVYVMNKGQIVYEGTPAGLEADEEVKRRYLGVA